MFQLLSSFFGLLVPLFASATIDSDPPVLTGLVIDRTSIDVSGDYQLVTLTINATDSTDAAGYDFSYACFKNIEPDGGVGNGSKCPGFNYSNGGSDSNGTFLQVTNIDGNTVEHRSNQMVFSSSDFAGNWVLDNVYLRDTSGNASSYSASQLEGLGLHSLLSVQDGVLNTIDLSLTASTPGIYLFVPSAPDTSTGVSYGGGVSLSNVMIENSNVWITGASSDYYTTYLFSITNNSSFTSRDVTLKIYSSGLYRSGFNHEAGTSTCYTTSINTEMLVTRQNCTLSAFSAGEKRDFILTLGTTDSSSTAWLNLSIYTSEPEVNMDDNTGFYAFSVNRDEDGDGVGSLQDAFPNDPTEIKDTDSDGVGDNADAFDLDASESVDTDGDGIGNNADLDDDNDGFSDEQEAVDGTNPLSRFSCRSGCFSFDIDENKEAKALSDGLLVIRHLFGFSGNSLTSGAITAEGARTSAEAISSYLSDADSELDVDGDGQSKALTDGLLLIRYLFGFSGDSLTAGAIGEGAERSAAGDIEKYISDRLPSE